MAVHIGIGFKSRMKNTASKKKTCLGFLLIVFLAYVVCYLLSQTVLREIYLFIAVCVFNAQATSANCISQICRFNRHYF